MVGTPGQRRQRLHQLRDEIGFDGILAELNCGGLIPHDRVLNALAPPVPGGHAAQFR